MAYGEVMTDTTDLTALATALIDSAREGNSGKAAQQIFSSPVLKAVLIGLRSGSGLAEHNAPPAATLQCLSGRVRLYAQDREWILGPGQYAAVPPERHGVDALEDSAVLLTVAASAAPPPVEVELVG